MAICHVVLLRMMYTKHTYEFDNKRLRVFVNTNKSDIVFALGDVAAILDIPVLRISNNMCADEVIQAEYETKVALGTKVTRIACLTVDGLYHVGLNCKNAEVNDEATRQAAHRFRKWITYTVIPCELRRQND